jgi:hypothetical protein
MKNCIGIPKLQILSFFFPLNGLALNKDLMRLATMIGVAR